MVDIQERVDKLLNEAEILMQLIEKSTIPCADIILAVLIRISKLKYFAFTQVHVTQENAHYAIRLRDKGIGETTYPRPYHLSDPPLERTPEELLRITLDINGGYWHKVSYQDQVILVKSLPMLVEKLIENVKEAYIAKDAELKFDVPGEAPKKKWWQRK
jgi:hypothetical protein